MKHQIEPNIDFWYAPAFILFAAKKWIKVNDPNINQKIAEVIPTAITCMALRENSKNDYWLQIVPDSEGTPDIRILSNENIDKKPYWGIMDVEVCELTKHSESDVAEFILDKKLCNQKKAYSKETVFIFYINQKTQLVWSEVYEKLKACNKQNNVYCVAQVRADIMRWHIVQVHPEINMFFDYSVQLRQIVGKAIEVKSGGLPSRGKIYKSGPVPDPFTGKINL